MKAMHDHRRHLLLRVSGECKHVGLLWHVLKCNCKEQVVCHSCCLSITPLLSLPPPNPPPSTATTTTTTTTTTATITQIT